MKKTQLTITYALLYSRKYTKNHQGCDEIHLVTELPAAFPEHPEARPHLRFDLQAGTGIEYLHKNFPDLPVVTLTDEGWSPWVGFDYDELPPLNEAQLRSLVAAAELKSSTDKEREGENGKERS